MLLFFGRGKDFKGGGLCRNCADALEGQVIHIDSLVFNSSCDFGGNMV